MEVGAAVAVGVAGALRVKLRLVVITKLARYIAVGFSAVGRTSPVAASKRENSTMTPDPLTAEACTSMRY